MVQPTNNNTALPQITGVDDTSTSTRFTSENIAAQGFHILPQEVQMEILSNLGIPDRAAAVQVCQQWEVLIGNVDDTLPYFLNHRDLKKLPAPKNIPMQKSLPPEMLEHIFSFLGGRDKRSAARVDSYCNAIISPNPLRILPPEMLEHILSFLDPKDLREASRVNLCWGNEIISYTIRRKIAEANAISNQYLQANRLRQISSAWIKRGNLVKARDVANLISHESTRGQVLENISRAWIERGNLVEARDVANSISHESTRGRALGKISRAWIERGNLVEARDVANSISHESRRQALENIFRAWVKRSNWVEARDVANSIPDENLLRDALRDISRSFIPDNI